MKTTPALKLSTRLVTFVTMFVVAAMFIIFIGGTLTFKNMGTKYVTNHLESITNIIDEQITLNRSLDRREYWLPKLMRSHDVIEMTLYENKDVYFHYENEHMQIDPAILPQQIEKKYRFKHNKEYEIVFKVFPPYATQTYSFDAFVSLTLAVLLVVFCLIKGLKWLKEQLYGSELLEERGRMLLAGQLENYAKGNENEWPYTASLALDQAIAELQDARQERSRFDTFIRTHTFLDQLTGAANRVLFDSKLESTLQESGMNGAVMLIEIRDWDEIKDQHLAPECDEFLLSVARTLSNLAQRYPQAVFSRYYEARFALLLPQQTAKEITRFAQQSIKQLERINPKFVDNLDNWCQIGLSFFSAGERRGKLIDEAETALREAQLLNENTWVRYKKDTNKIDEFKGQVRWRNLFDQAFEKKELILFEQTCFSVSEQNTRQPISHEILTRIQDGNEIIKASHFINALEQVGYETRFDTLALELSLQHIKNSDPNKSFTLNLFVTPFEKKEYRLWFRDTLLQLPRCVLERLSFEFVEREIITDLDRMRHIIRFISALGAKVIIEHVGRTIVSTHYLKGINVDAIKLHRSLVKQIDKRTENQLFIRSLIGACQDIDIQVYAVGVENEQEWSVLKGMGIHVGQGRGFEKEIQVYPIHPKTQNQTLSTKVKKVIPGRRNRWR